MIYLHTLGDARIVVGEKEIRPTSPLLFAALLYLGLERGRRVPRAALQELLFPDADERSGSHSLRQLLYKLRRFGVPVDADGSSIGLPVEQVRDDCTPELSLTNGHGPNVDKCAVGFLPDYRPQLSERYEEWLEQRRSFVTAGIRRQLVAAMGASREALNWSAVDQFARTILALDPFNEEATLALAEATALSGSKAEALEMLSRYEQETGRSDLRLASSLLRKRISERVSDSFRSNLSTPFVGREADAEVVRQQMHQARNGQPSLIVISGQPGMGKTRLLEECTALASLEGLGVHVVRCQPHYRSRPLAVFIELVPALLSSRGALGISPESLTHLKYLTSHNDDRADRPIDSRDDATRSDVLLAALRDLIDAVSTETPLVLAIEDAHWADVDSLHEVSALVRSNAARSLVVICTTRQLEPLQSAGVIDDATVIRRLQPLAHEPMAELTRHLLPHTQGSDSADAIASFCIQTAAGNPLFLQMLCAHHVQTGQAFSVPPDLVSATTRRVEYLPQRSRRILEFCASLGRHCSIDVLTSLAECTHLELLNLVQRLEEEGYIRLKDDAIRTTHDLLSECTLNLLAPLSRRLLHACVAAELERRYDMSSDAALLWDCAEQWSLSGETAKAIQFLKRCARHASQIGRAAQALALLERAKQFAKSPADTADIIGEMMLAAKAAGQWSDVLELSREWSAIPTDARPVSGHTNQEFLEIEARWIARFELADSVSQLVSCVTAPTANDEHRLDAATMLLRFAHEQGDRALAERTYSAVEALIDPQSTSHSNRFVPLLYHASFGDRDTCVGLARALVRDISSFEQIGTQCRAAHHAGTTLVIVGELDEARSLFEALYEKARNIGMNAWQQDACCHTALCYIMQEDFGQAESWYERFDNSGAPAILAYVHIANGIELALWKRDPALATARRQAVHTGISESLRLHSYLRGVDVRIQQLDPRCDCDDGTLNELRTVFESTKRLSCADGLALALGEALRRRRRFRDVAMLLDDYVGSARRERSPMPPSLAQLAHLCQQHS